MSAPPLLPSAPLPKRGTVTVEKVTWAGTERRHIAVAAFPDWYANGWGFVSVEAEPEPDPPAPVRVPAPTRDLWPREALLRMGNQVGQWAGKVAMARKALDASADALSDLIDRPPIRDIRPRNQGGPMAPSSVYATDLLSAAYIAESVVVLRAQVEALQAEIVAMKQEGK